ncbi:hypothetical protein E2C01_048311 [Portunus trituberculatus]|uniref:Uncharacterized protein n=1 Tax=Portunus trituberculatus TaxID=210409 RepID=A0A5B7GA81_PORTR|nr:hypothetical protein [Portunus trituberculatus]
MLRFIFLPHESPLTQFTALLTTTTTTRSSTKPLRGVVVLRKGCVRLTTHHTELKLLPFDTVQTDGRNRPL